ncbi:DinB family protein [Marinoscillum furvescens]|uniref:DinB family protein n=1 Tax=Marinoscillum furvescens DSM 4134 TaxID=1122208 RepID=A0A3D9LHW0_MARFU|nr:DinB family protein [Marinoscillum furvescens]REE05609.1 DinB family protein [Marinoscillum furvescens DSM 4134]
MVKINQVEFLEKQTLDAYHWSKTLVSQIPEKYWEEEVPVIDSSISWQVGHLVTHTYLHAIITITGHQSHILEQVPIKTYDRLYKDNYSGTHPEKPENLSNHLDQIQLESLGILRQLTTQDLLKPLEPTRTPHPVAKTKFESLDWNIKHTMWHCGQIATMARVLKQAK